MHRIELTSLLLALIYEARERLIIVYGTIPHILEDSFRIDQLANHVNRQASVSLIR